MLKEYIPNSMMHVMLLTVGEIIGEEGLNRILDDAGLGAYRGNLPPNDDRLGVPGPDFAKIVGGVVAALGEEGARPVLEQVGRRGFQLTVEKSPALMGFMGLALKLLSKRKRLERVFELGAQSTNKIFGENQRFYVSEEGLVFELFDCYWCKGLVSKGPICFGEVGVDKEVAKWATGEEHDVREVLCRAKGDDVCKFVISFEPKKTEGDSEG
jgi:predicted hydrocarbon binding protein